MHVSKFRIGDIILLGGDDDRVAMIVADMADGVVTCVVADSPRDTFAAMRAEAANVSRQCRVSRRGEERRRCRREDA